jgi:chemotaxis protein CheX
MDKTTLAKFIFSAAEETFATMLGLQVTQTEAPAEDTETETASERVVALIGIAGHYNGTGIISCSPEIACKLSSQMLMADYQAINSEVLDAMSEISNIVFGNVKTMLEEQVGLLGLSIPTVIFGRNFCTRSVGEQWITVPLKVDEQDLQLRMCLSQNHSSTRANTIRQPVPTSA